MEQLSLHPANHGQNIHVLNGSRDAWQLLKSHKKPDYVAIALGSSRFQDLIQKGPGLQAAIKSGRAADAKRSIQGMFAIYHVRQAWVPVNDKCICHDLTCTPSLTFQDMSFKQLSTSQLSEGFPGKHGSPNHA